MKTQITLLAAAMFSVLAGISSVHAKPFKWSSASDIPTLDIHSQNNALGNGVHAAVYDALVYYNSQTFKPEPNWQRRGARSRPPRCGSPCAAASSSAMGPR